MSQSLDTNRTRIEHLSLSAITIGSKELAISSARLGKNRIVDYNQASFHIDIRGHVDQYFPFRSRKSGNKIIVDFGRNANEEIVMNPLRTIGIPLPYITRTRQRSFDIL